jgi:hypothetical protein
LIKFFVSKGRRAEGGKLKLRTESVDATEEIWDKPDKRDKAE